LKFGHFSKSFLLLLLLLLLQNLLLCENVGVGGTDQFLPKAEDKRTGEKREEEVDRGEEKGRRREERVGKEKGGRQG
jgi:hypothetical protein